MLRKILRVLWTAKKTNEWVLNKAGVNTELLDTVKARMLAYYGHTMRKQGSCLEIMQGTNKRCTHARKTTHSLNGYQYVVRTPHVRVNQNNRRELNGESMSMEWPTLGCRTAKEQNRPKHQRLTVLETHTCLFMDLWLTFFCHYVVLFLT